MLHRNTTIGIRVKWGWAGFGSIEGTVHCWHLRHWCCRLYSRSAMCICAGWRRARPSRSLIPLLSHSRQRRRNCLSLRISSGSSIPSMSHDRSLGLRGSLSERALRPWPKAAVLLISWLRAFRSFRRTTVQSNRAHLPRLNVPRFVAIGKATVCLAFQKHCLADYDVTGSLPRPLVRGHAGRLSPAGST